MVLVQVEMELGMFLGNGNVWYAGPTDAGLHVPVAIGVLNPEAPFPTLLPVVHGGLPLVRLLPSGGKAPRRPERLGSLLLRLASSLPPAGAGWC